MTSSCYLEDSFCYIEHDEDVVDEIKGEFHPNVTHDLGFQAEFDEYGGDVDDDQYVDSEIKRLVEQKRKCWGCFLSITRSNDLIHKFHNAPVPYPTMHHSKNKCEHFCSEWCIMGYRTGISSALAMEILRCCTKPSIT